MAADYKVSQQRVSQIVRREKKRREQDERDAAAAGQAKKVLGKDALSVYHGNSFELASDIPDESCALIFTDPPYTRESLSVYDDLASLAGRILIEGGSLVTFCGNYAMVDTANRLEVQPLRYFWTCCCLHTGNTARMREYGIKVKWKPLLWFVKGFRRSPRTWVEDLVKSQQEKFGHPWQQSVIEAEDFIDRLSKPGELVVDPFCGSGTTAVAAKKLGRQWWTCDTEGKHVATARRRLQEVSQ